jgi:hypothetical protein
LTALIECRRGWWAVRALDGQRGYIPSTPDTPGAIEDLNRWAVFRSTGADKLYERREEGAMKPAGEHLK